MDKERLENFVPYPRRILDDLHGKELTPNEYDTYMRLRHEVNLYAVAIVSLEGLTAVFKHRRWSKNYITKLLSALKRKRYIHYKDRAGSRGLFKVLFPEIVLPNKQISKLPTSNAEKNASTVIGATPERSEVSQSLPPLSPSLADIKQRSQALVQKFSLPSVRGAYNDTDTEKENKRLSYPLKREKSVNDFVSNSHQDDLCKRIAKALGEQNMNYLLGIRHKHGFLLIEQAWREYERADKTKIENPPRYFNGIVKQLIAPKDNSP